MGETHDIRMDLERDGFVIIPGVIKEPELTTLRNAVARVTKLARDGGWKYVRTLPKQFPPWTDDVAAGIWGVQHLMHPDMPGRTEFARTYFMESVIGPVKEIIGCENDDELIMELYNVLVRPDHDFELRWHRDDIAADATAEQELERLNKPAWHAQWNLALFDDNSLIAVPGSHKRARTDDERETPVFSNKMPGQQIVPMKAGDVVFYNNNILHRGVYDSTIERMTLHGSIGHVKGNKERARNVLQHGVGSWIEKCEFVGLPEGLQGRANVMKANLLELGKAGDVGFAHED